MMVTIIIEHESSQAPKLNVAKTSRWNLHCDRETEREREGKREREEDVVVAAAAAKISRVDCNKQFNGGYRMLIVFNAQYTHSGRWWSVQHIFKIGEL